MCCRGGFGCHLDVVAKEEIAGLPEARDVSIENLLQPLEAFL